jgi:alpha-galactosidase
MKAVGDAAHAAGLDFILWVEPERVMKGLCVGNLTCGYNEAIELLRAHPEWGRCVGGVNTQPTGKDLGSIQCLWYYGAAGALEWMQQRLSSMIEDWGVDIYRQDRNGASPYGYWKLGETAERVGASEALHIGGMYDLFDHLKVSKPSLLIDNCASGGRRLDLEMMRRSIPLHRTDWQPSPTFTPAQGHTYGLSQFIPVQGPSYGVDSMPCYPWTPAEICLPNKTAALSMFSPTQSVGISQDPQGGWHDWGNETDAWWADFLRINELLQPLRPLLKGDFYPLTEWSGIDENGWLAWFVHTFSVTF